jgi:hypothetical protein
MRVYLMVLDEGGLIVDEADDLGIILFRYLHRALTAIRKTPLVFLLLGTNSAVANFYSRKLMSSD